MKNRAVNHAKRVLSLYKENYSLVFVHTFLVLLLSLNLSAATYTTVANGNWKSTTTWQGGSVPPADGKIKSGDVVYIRHTIYYNNSNSIENSGTIYLEPLAGTIARLDVPSGKNFLNKSTGKFYGTNAAYVQYRFVGGGNSGTPQSGLWKNEGGLVVLTNMYVEVAQDWTSESGGKRKFIGGCLYTGQNFSIGGSASVIHCIMFTSR